MLRGNEANSENRHLGVPCAQKLQTTQAPETRIRNQSVLLQTERS